jgi:hypothetical protein
MVEATRLGLYRAKCMPDHTAIIARARRMRKNHPLLRSIYILTDGPDEWVEETRRWLVSDAWEKVWVGKADIYPNWADREIGIAADMEVARRAGVFVGNGVRLHGQLARFAWSRSRATIMTLTKTVLHNVVQHCASAYKGRPASRFYSVLVVVVGSMLYILVVAVEQRE